MSKEIEYICAKGHRFMYNPEWGERTRCPVCGERWTKPV